MRLTFDTNVWNRMVFPERHVNEPNYLAFVRIKDAIRTGYLSGFISEGFITMEAIKKEDRAKLYAQCLPEIKVTSKSCGQGLHCMTIEINGNHHLHPGVGGLFEQELQEALTIGMRLLSTPYIGSPIPDLLRNNPQIYAEEVFATSEYNERFGEISGTIVARGVGEGALATLARNLSARLDGPRPASLSDRDLIYGVYEYAREAGLKKDEAQIVKAFAESADGDLVAAHIAFGNEFLCTEDRGRSALSPSIFDLENRAWLKETYGVKFLDTQQLAALL